MYTCISECHSRGSQSFWFLPEASFGLRVLSLPAPVCVYQSLSVRKLRACSSWDHRIWTKDFKIPIVLGGGYWPWLSRSNLTAASKFTPFPACMPHNSSPGQVWITKFGPEVQNIFVNSSPPGQNGRNFGYNIFRRVFVNEKVFILIKISLKFVPKGLIDNNPALVHIMTCRRIGDKPSPEPMLTRFTDAYMRH